MSSDQLSSDTKRKITPSSKMEDVGSTLFGRVVNTTAPQQTSTSSVASLAGVSTSAGVGGARQRSQTIMGTQAPRLPPRPSTVRQRIPSESSDSAASTITHSPSPPHPPNLNQGASTRSPSINTVNGLNDTAIGLGVGTKLNFPNNPQHQTLIDEFIMLEATIGNYETNIRTRYDVNDPSNDSAIERDTKDILEELINLEKMLSDDPIFHKRFDMLKYSFIQKAALFSLHIDEPEVVVPEPVLPLIELAPDNAAAQVNTGETDRVGGGSEGTSQPHTIEFQKIWQAIERIEKSQQVLKTRYESSTLNCVTTDRFNREFQKVNQEISNLGKNVDGLSSLTNSIHQSFRAMRKDFSTIRASSSVGVQSMPPSHNQSYADLAAPSPLQPNVSSLVRRRTAPPNVPGNNPNYSVFGNPAITAH